MAIRSAYEMTSRIGGQPDPYVVTVDGGDPDQLPTLLPRRQRVINATSGQVLGDDLGRATTAAVRQAPISRAVEQASAGPRTVDMYRWIFGV